MKNPVFSNLPKVGIRPAIDGRLGGVRESLSSDHEHGEKYREAHCGNVALSDRRTGRGGDCRFLHRRRGGSGGVCGEIPPRKCGRLPHRHALLVLRFRDDGCRSAHSQGGLGIQWHGASRRGLSRGGAGRPLPQKGLPAFGIYGRDVQESTDTTIPDDVAEKFCASCAPGLAVSTMRGKAYLAMGGTSMGIAGVDRGPGAFRTPSRHARRVDRHDGVHSPHREGNLRQGRVRQGARLGEKELSRGQRIGTARSTSAAARNSTKNGKSPSRWPSSRGI